MNEEDTFQTQRKKAIKNLKLYIIFNLVFIVFNLLLIHYRSDYSFPKNFFAIWPLLGWGAPTFLKFLELRRYK